jgi:predicted DNA-binding antitoxin AbrB/MazE fold protein
MTFTAEPIYENGSLKPAQPFPVKEQERVQVAVQTASNWVTETAGMIPWTGDHETLRRSTEDAEFDPEEQAWPSPISRGKRERQPQMNTDGHR